VACVGRRAWYWTCACAHARERKVQSGRSGRQKRDGVAWPVRGVVRVRGGGTLGN
jgi:hypothetical protein